MTNVLTTAGVSDTGLVHPINEDAWQIDRIDDATLLLICDGMGGMGRGDEASKLAVATTVAALKAAEGTWPERLTTAILRADTAVREALCVEGSKPGATAVAVVIEGTSAWAAWVGDSRAYWVRGEQILARTRDHKLVQGLIDAGQMTIEEAKRSSLSSVLSQSLGGRLVGDPPPEVATMPVVWELEPGDRIMLCSDGVVDLVDDDEIGPLLTVQSPQDAAQHLVHLANDRGGHDNSTVIVAAWGPAIPKRAAPSMGPTEGFAPSRDEWPDDDDDQSGAAHFEHDITEQTADAPTSAGPPGTPEVPDLRRAAAPPTSAPPLPKLVIAAACVGVVVAAAFVISHMGG